MFFFDPHTGTQSSSSGPLGRECADGASDPQPDGSCPLTEDMQPQPDPCNTVGDPIVVPTGAVYRSETDFTTADGRLKIDRHYRNQTMTGARIAFDEPRGLAKRWRFGFAAEMHMNSFFKTNGTVWVHMPDGGSYGFTRDPTTGELKPRQTTDHPLPQTSLKLRFVGSWPARVDLLHTSASRWELTDSDDRKWLLETQPHFVYSREHLIARPIQITERDGYRWTLTYGDNHRLTSITDTFGRTMSFTWIVRNYSGIPNYNRPHMPLAVSKITLPDGRSINYTYDALSTNSGVAEADRLSKVEIKTADNSIVHATGYAYTDARWPLSLTAVTDAKGVQITTYTYDDYNRATNTQEIGGADSVSIVYSDTRRAASRRTRTVTNALGKQEVWVYQSLGSTKNDPQLIRKTGKASTNCPASATSLTYDTNHFVSRETDEESRVTAYKRDALGRPTSITRGHGTPEATTTTYTYHAALNVPAKIVEPGKTTDDTYNAAGQLTQRTVTDTTSHTVPYSTNGQARTWTYTYGAGGRLLTVDGPLAGTADTVTYAYDTRGNLTSVTNEVGHITQITTHNAIGKPTTIIDPNGVTTTLSYDANNRLTTITVDPGTKQAVTVLAYDAIGQVTKITQPDRSAFTYTYNDARRLTVVTSSDGEKIEYTHDLMGNVTATVIRKADSTITFSQTQMFDELGRLLKHIGAYNQTTTYAYEKNNNLKSVTDPRSGVYAYGYDAVNRLIRETDQNNAVVAYTKDGQDNTTAYTDPRSLATTYVRNGFGEVIQRVSPDTGTTIYVRDTDGRVTQATDARGVVTSYTYDAAGRILSQAYPGSASETVTYTYDANSGGNKGIGRLTGIANTSTSLAYSYDVRGNVTSVAQTINGTAHTVTYGYDAADRIQSITYPTGRGVYYTRDSHGRIINVGTRKSRSDPWTEIAQNIAYQPMSAIVQSMDFGNGLNTWNTFTLDYQIDVLSVYDGTASRINRAHTRTDNLNLTNIWDNITSANNQSFWYTAANRLQNAAGPWGAKTFYYDAVGNRTHHTSTPLGGTATTDVLGYPADSNRITDVTVGGSTTRQFTYDAAGNITGDNRLGSNYAYAYNHAGQIESVTFAGTLKASYEYNGLKQLAIREITNSGSANGTTHLVHDIWGNVIAETDGTGVAGTVREYIWIPGVGYAGVSLPLAVVDGVNTVSPALYYVHTDHLSRPIMMTDTTKVQVWSAIWSPFGQAHSITGTLTEDRRFPGQWFQLESGLHYNWHRHYDPTIGRYTSGDPLGLEDGPNVYGYAHGQPIGYVDPDGRFALSALIGAATGALGEYLLNPCATTRDLVLASLTGALGGGVAGKLAKSAFVNWSKGLPIAIKGRIGEQLSYIKHRIRGSQRLGTHEVIRGHRARNDSRWRGRGGNIYHVESKFGTSNLRTGQRQARNALGPGTYRVDKWDYDWLGAWPAGIGAALAAAGITGASNALSECSCTK